MWKSRPSMMLLARIARGEGMILLPASFSAIQRQGVAFCPVAEGDAMPLSLGDLCASPGRVRAAMALCWMAGDGLVSG
jgi:hypothetical protein